MLNSTTIPAVKTEMAMMCLIQKRSAPKSVYIEVLGTSGPTSYNITSCIPLDPCKESIYPPGFIPKCTVLQKQWTYNQTSRECVEFGYHPCGEDRDGYDVFTSEFECIRTCVHQGD